MDDGCSVGCTDVTGVGFNEERMDDGCSVVDCAEVGCTEGRMDDSSSVGCTDVT